jgi:hypothetical protein
LIFALRLWRIAWSEGFSDAVDDRGPVALVFVSVR